MAIYFLTYFPRFLDSDKSLGAFQEKFPCMKEVQACKALQPTKRQMSFLDALK